MPLAWGLKAIYNVDDKTAENGPRSDAPWHPRARQQRHEGSGDATTTGAGQARNSSILSGQIAKSLICCAPSNPAGCGLPAAPAADACR
jgi:hypothetical protein